MISLSGLQAELRAAVFLALEEQDKVEVIISRLSCWLNAVTFIAFFCMSDLQDSMCHFDVNSFK